MSEKYISIAIDGPSGVGKTSIAKSIAREKGYLYIDTGAMFRALSVCFLERGIEPDEEEEIGAALEDVHLKIRYEDGTQHMIVNDQDVTSKLRTEAVSRAASVISQFRAVRSRLLEMQRELAASANTVMDGRDIGTVVLPNATLKIFLTARAKVRAERRYKQLLELGQLDGATLESITKDIEERDYRDSHREIAPLKAAEDAVTIDTSDVSIEEVKAAILRALQNKLDS